MDHNKQEKVLPREDHKPHPRTKRHGFQCRNTFQNIPFNSFISLKYNVIYEKDINLTVREDQEGDRKKEENDRKKRRRW